MRKPGLKQLLVELPIEVADALDSYCDTNGKVKSWVVRRAIETFLLYESRSTLRFIVNLEEATAENLEAFRRARDNAPPEDVAKSAIEHYVTFMLNNETITRQRYEALKNEIRAEREELKRSNLSVFDGGKR